MDAHALKDLMGKQRLTATRVASMLYVSKRAVYTWLDGSRTMPRLAWEHLKLRVEMRKAEQEGLLNLMNRSAR
jgi:predicted transcriptional regulator